MLTDSSLSGSKEVNKFKGPQQRKSRIEFVKEKKIIKRKAGGKGKQLGGVSSFSQANKKCK